MKIGAKLTKVGESFSVTIVDNGFLFEVSGRTPTEDWKTVKFICDNRDVLNRLIDETLSLPRDE